MDPVWLIVATLATWRLSFMVTQEIGPFQSMVYLRTRLYQIRGLSALADCLWCASVWIGILCTGLMVIPYARWLMVPFALSAGAIFAHTLLPGRSKGTEPRSD